VPKLHNKPIQKNKLGFKRKEQKGTEELPGLAHRTVRCTTGQCPVHQGRLTSILHSRVSFRRTPLNFTGLSGAPPDCPVCQRSNGYLRAMVDSERDSTVNSERDRSQSRSQKGTGLSGAPPDSPVTHEDKASNGRPAPSPNGRMTWRTGHCPMAHQTLSGAPIASSLSPTAISCLVAINTTPTGHFKVWESKQHSKSSS
jgi:hypothetical protein